MLIDSFQPGWQLVLAQQHGALPAGKQLFLLIDGAFVPGLWRLVDGEPFLLFETLPGCTEDTKDVSPFIARFDPNDRSLARVLERCDGFPMLSAIATREDIGYMGQRLAAWCIVEVDGQRFNFRFPDTRRLPAIFDAMTPAQRRAFAGSASSWHYVGRDGTWRRLPLEGVTEPAEMVVDAKLDDRQFARLVEDSEADELWTRLRYRGIEWHGLSSQRHRLLSQALVTARAHCLDEMQTIRWCSHCLEAEADDSNLDHRIAQWKRDNEALRSEILPGTV